MLRGHNKVFLVSEHEEVAENEEADKWAWESVYVRNRVSRKVPTISARKHDSIAAWTKVHIQTYTVVKKLTKLENYIDILIFQSNSKNFQKIWDNLIVFFILRKAQLPGSKKLYVTH